MDWTKTATASDDYLAAIDDQLRVIEDAARMCRECGRCEATWFRLPSGEVERCDCFIRYQRTVKKLQKLAPKDWDEHMTDSCWNVKQHKAQPLMSDGRFSEMRKLQHFLTEDVLPGDVEMRHVSPAEWDAILSGLPSRVREKLRAVFRLVKDRFSEAV